MKQIKNRIKNKNVMRKLFKIIITQELISKISDANSNDILMKG